MITLVLKLCEPFGLQPEYQEFNYQIKKHIRNQQFHWINFNSEQFQNQLEGIIFFAYTL